MTLSSLNRACSAQGRGSNDQDHIRCTDGTADHIIP